jgi:hypothetical protein
MLAHHRQDYGLTRFYVLEVRAPSDPEQQFRLIPRAAFGAPAIACVTRPNIFGVIGDRVIAPSWGSGQTNTHQSALHTLAAAARRVAITMC